MLPLETHIFAYKLCNPAYVLIYKHFWTYNKCSCRYCGCSDDFDENFAPAKDDFDENLAPAKDELVVAILHCEKEESKNNHIFFKKSNCLIEKKKGVFMIKQ